MYFLWRTSRSGDKSGRIGRGFKKLDIFQSKQKEGSHDVKSDQNVGWHEGIFFGQRVCTYTQRNSVELLTTSLEDGGVGRRVFNA